MEREIKFRGKTINGNEWIYGPTISQGTIKRKANKWFMEVAENKWKGLQPNTLGQYTGLKDKNGKEIYEGDIIRSFDSNDDAILHYIVWEEARFVALYKGRNFSSKCFLKQDWLDEFDKEVIGNIHDNPELLKYGRD